MSAEPFPRRTPSRLAAASLEIQRTASLTGATMLAALNLVLNQFTVAINQFLEVGFAFLASAVTGFLYGPWLAGMAGVVTDLAGYLFRPNGAFFIGWALSEFLQGFLYGCWFYKKPVSLLRTICACLSATVLINLCLTPLWLHIMYGEVALLSAVRLVKNLIKLPIDVGLLYTVLKAVEHRRPRTLA